MRVSFFLFFVVGALLEFICIGNRKHCVASRNWLWNTQVSAHSTGVADAVSVAACRSSRMLFAHLNYYNIRTLSWTKWQFEAWNVAMTGPRSISALCAQKYHYCYYYYYKWMSLKTRRELVHSCVLRHTHTHIDKINMLNGIAWGGTKLILSASGKNRHPAFIKWSSGHKSVMYALHSPLHTKLRSLSNWWQSLKECAIRFTNCENLLNVLLTCGAVASSIDSWFIWFKR